MTAIAIVAAVITMMAPIRTVIAMTMNWIIAVAIIARAIIAITISRIIAGTIIGGPVVTVMMAVVIDTPQYQG
jgi:hypothetical protein